jgi:hypothetical protein
MNAFSALQPNENIIRQERFHPGIFGLPVLLLVALLLPTIPVIGMFSAMRNIVGQISPTATQPIFSTAWLLLIFIGLLPPLVFFFVILVAYQNSQFTLTNKRLIYRTGFIARVAGELPLENVEAMFLLEPLLGRLLGYGTVTVSSVGGLRLPLEYLGKPHVFHAALQRAVSEAKGVNRSAPKPSVPAHGDSRYMPK